MTRNSSAAKSKRTNKHSSRGRDQELLTSGQELLNMPKTDGSGCFRAMYPGECPRCEKRIAVGQEIHRHADLPACQGELSPLVHCKSA
jgi:hypothetical protein